MTVACLIKEVGLCSACIARASGISQRLVEVALKHFSDVLHVTDDRCPDCRQAASVYQVR